jgi:muramoyltetrapeptide carboxypeptidase
MSQTKIGIVAPSSKIPSVELKLGIKKIQQEGFSVRAHPQCKKSHLFFAGTDEERVSAFLEFAYDPDIEVVWCARGGHGALRLLPLIEKSFLTRGAPPRKLLVGYSDITALMEYVRKKWGWQTLHAPMPSMRKFSILDPADWRALSSWIQRKTVEAPWEKKTLQFWTHPPQEAIEATLVGGNLTVWNCMLGTPFQASAKDSILFLEDVDESLYRIDRMLQQLLLSESLKGIRGIVLGNFLNCRDGAPLVLKKAPPEKNRFKHLTSPKPKDLKPLRKVMKEKPVLQEIFSRVGRELGIPVAYGLPVGHGPEVSPLPLGAHYRLTPSGHLELVNWDWLLK